MTPERLVVLLKLSVEDLSEIWDNDQGDLFMKALYSLAAHAELYADEEEEQWLANLRGAIGHKP